MNFRGALHCANAVLPGTIDTPQNRAAMPNADTSKWVAPEAIADVIVFLASDAASYITGQVLAADGGFDSTGVGLPALRG